MTPDQADELYYAARAAIDEWEGSESTDPMDLLRAMGWLEKAVRQIDEAKASESISGVQGSLPLDVN